MGLRPDLTPGDALLRLNNVQRQDPQTGQSTVLPQTGQSMVPPQTGQSTVQEGSNALLRRVE